MSKNNSIEGKPLLYFTVFTGGMSTLAIEFTVSRILQTVYGTSNIVWANVIGLVLVFLSVGYFVGGRSADRNPSYKYFYTLITLAGFCAIFFLLLSSVLIRQTANALASFNGTVLIGSFLGVIIALAIPITILGMVSPFAIRLAVDDVAKAGRVSGQIYALSTLGSLLGTWIPVLIVIPLAGSRMTAIIFGSILFIVGLFGVWRSNGQMAVSLLGLILIPTVWYWGFGPLKNRADAIFEAESAYNYIQVIRQEQCNYLLLNEGVAFHSFYCDDGSLPSVSVWSSMLAAPYFYPSNDFEAPEKMLVIGLAGGTVPQQFLRVFPQLAVDGIEPDPEIIEVGKNFFALNDPRIQSIVGDGRFELNRAAGPYDVITIDAYRVPYIPWHLTTTEFFSEVQTQLADDGVVAINVGRVPEDRRLVEALTATMETVFPTVHTADIPGSLNTILYATNKPTDSNNLLQHLSQMPADADPLIPAVLTTVQSGLRPTVRSDIVFTDDVAPVETIVDSLVLRFIFRSGLQGILSTN
ncbi:MAG: fused MFS/spermidine synthase [Chloroflexota bacterium]